MIDIPQLGDELYTPEVGEVYWVDSSIVRPADRKLSRPVLVVLVPPMGSRFTIVSRTSNTARRPGVLSPADPEMGLNKAGVWGYVGTVDAQLWRPSMVSYCGLMSVEVLRDVREEFGL